MIRAEWTNRDNLSIETTGLNSKAILVIECIPENCGKCRLADFGKCWGSKSYIHLSTKDRPKECPLRPLPQKREVEVNEIKDIMHTEFQTTDVITDKFIADIKFETDKFIALGYNSCIDDIMG